MMKFWVLWVAGGQLHEQVIAARSEQALRNKLDYWWGRVAADFEIIQIEETV